MTVASRAAQGTMLLLGMIVASPFLVYAATLASIEGRPEPVPVRATAAVTCRGETVVRMFALEPYGPLFTGWTASAPPRHPGHEEATWLARTHLLTLPRSSMGVWHLRSAALHIWIVQHWTPQQITDTARRDGACMAPRRAR